MIKALIKFNKGLLRMPIHWRGWLLLLMAANMIIPFFYLGRAEAQAVLAAFFISAVLMVVITAASGFTRLLGLGHILWIPLLYFLWSRLDQHAGGDFYGLWLRAIILINGLSLVIDAVDVVRYFAGERMETVQGL